MSKKKAFNEQSKSIGMQKGFLWVPRYTSLKGDNSLPSFPQGSSINKYVFIMVMMMVCGKVV